jgi:uncharacterized protein YbjT (DUF2867 family)
MKKISAAIIGASGLVGSELLSCLLQDDHFDQIHLLNRRPLGIAHPKITEHIIDFSDNEALRDSLKESRIIFCTIGTTLKKVKGDKKLYRQIDFEIPLKAALIGKELGVDQFLLVTAYTANSKSRNFYLRLKGEVEEAITSLDLSSFSVFHPSVLLGNRKEFRPAEWLAIKLLPLVEWMFPFNYRSIKASAVAKAMACAAVENKKGHHVYNRKEMFKFISKDHSK